MIEPVRVRPVRLSLLQSSVCRDLTGDSGGLGSIPGLLSYVFSLPVAFDAMEFTGQLLPEENIGCLSSSAKIILWEECDGQTRQTSI